MEIKQMFNRKETHVIMSPQTARIRSIILINLSLTMILLIRFNTCDE